MYVIHWQLQISLNVSLSKPLHHSSGALSNQTLAYRKEQDSKEQMGIKQFGKIACSTESITNYEWNVDAFLLVAVHWLSE